MRVCCIRSLTHPDADVASRRATDSRTKYWQMTLEGSLRHFSAYLSRSIRRVEREQIE